MSVFIQYFGMCFNKDFVSVKFVYATLTCDAEP